MAPFFFRPIAYDRRNGQLPRPKRIDPWREKLVARTGGRPIYRSSAVSLNLV